MDVLALLEKFRNIGFVVELTSEGKLKADGPKHPDAARLIAELKQHKAEVIAALSAPAASTTPPPVAAGYVRVPLSEFAQEELFLIEAIHGEGEWQDPDRYEDWAPKRQLAETARSLAAQNIIPKEAYRMSVIAGHTSKEAGYIAKLVRDGDWRTILEEKHIRPKVDRLAALLAAA